MKVDLLMFVLLVIAGNVSGQEYRKITSGVCAAIGMFPIKQTFECEAASLATGGSDTCVGCQSDYSDMQWAPFGCYEDEGFWLWVNLHGGSFWNPACSERPVICKSTPTTRGLPAGLIPISAQSTIPVDCSSCVAAGFAWQIGECQTVSNSIGSAVTKEDYCAVQDAACYFTEELCALDCSTREGCEACLEDVSCAWDAAGEGMCIDAATAAMDSTTLVFSCPAPVSVCMLRSKKKGCRKEPGCAWVSKAAKGSKCQAETTCGDFANESECKNSAAPKKSLKPKPKFPDGGRKCKWYERFEVCVVEEEFECRRRDDLYSDRDACEATPGCKAKVKGREFVGCKGFIEPRALIYAP